MRSRSNTIAVAAAIALLTVVGLLVSIVWRGVEAPSWRVLTAGQRVDQHQRYAATKKCAECHTSPHRPPLVGACERCHVTLGDWKSATHRHLVPALDSGSHKGLACSQCHRGGFQRVASTCATCHRTYGHARSPDCESCHNTKSWSVSHTLPKKHVRLVGDHKKLACPDCHSLHDRSRVFRCNACHKKHTPNFQLANSHGGGLACITCHTVTGKRDNLNVLSIRAKDCAACHKPQHVSLNDCGRCHNNTSFAKSTFQHDSLWPRTGAHASLKCTSCHRQNQFASVAGTNCASCHEVRHTGLTNCASCHSSSSFTPAQFQHSSVYRLAGKHSSIACDRCHPRNDYGLARGNRCATCHGARHGGLTDCARCHTTSRFKPSTFLHSTVWPKTGAHTRVACNSCHPKGAYTVTKGRTCVACHGEQHGGQPLCDVCHTTTAWSPILPYPHPDKWPLIGQHRYVECAACHTNLEFPGTPSRCVSCHADKSHGMPKCEKCHTPVSWKRILPHSMGF